MSIKKYIRDILSQLDTPSYLMVNKNNNDCEYIVYNIASEFNTSISDDKNEFKKYKVLFRIYSKGDFEDIFKKLDNLLIQNRFEFDNAAELYDDELDIYQKSIYYSILF